MTVVVSPWVLAELNKPILSTSSLRRCFQTFDCSCCSLLSSWLVSSWKFCELNSLQCSSLRLWSAEGSFKCPLCVIFITCPCRRVILLAKIPTHVLLVIVYPLHLFFSQINCVIRCSTCCMCTTDDFYVSTVYCTCFPWIVSHLYLQFV